MSNAPADPTGVGFSMVLPDTWTVVDLDPRTRDRSIEQQVRAAVGKADQWAQLRRELTTLYRRTINDAADHAAFFAANMGQPVEGGALGASLLAFLAPLPVGEDRAPLTDVAQLSAALSDTNSAEPVGDWTVLDLPIGPAVRTRGLVGSGLRASDGREPQVDVVQYFVPVAHWGVLLVLAFSTPTLAVADAFAELFDVLARSAQWKP